MQGAIKTPVRHTSEAGEEYEFEKIGVNIWAEFTEWYNKRIGDPPGKAIDPDMMMFAASSFPCMRWLLWRSLQQKHPTIKVRDVEGVFDNIGQLTDTFIEIIDKPDKPKDADEGAAEDESDPPHGAQ